MAACTRAVGPRRKASTSATTGRSDDRRVGEIVAALGERRREAREIGPGPRSGRAGEKAPRRAAKTSGVGSATPGLTSRIAQRRQRRRRRQPLAHARGERGTAGEAHRHVGAEPRGKIEQLLDRQRHPPQIDQRPQRRRGIGRAAAEAGRHGNVLGETKRGARRHAGPVGQQARGLQHEIVGFAGERRRASGPSTVERQPVGRRASISSARSVKATSESSR